MSRAVGTGLLVVLAFAAGLFTHGLYQRWNPLGQRRTAGKGFTGRIVW